MSGGLESDTDSDTDTDSEFDTLTAYMAANGLDLPEMTTDWILDPQTVFDAGTENYFIVDIRTSDKYEAGVEDFAEGHIAGAHSVAMADVLTYVTDNNTEGLPVLVVCYTGQSAAWTTMALRLSGIDAYTLKWGMSGWHSDLDLWTSALADAALDYDGSWDTSAEPTLPAFETFPTIATGESDGAAILAAQVEAEILAGMGAKKPADVLPEYDEYYVVNYWSQADWDHYGHITDAYRITPNELTLDTLAWLDPRTPVVVYCWTGQTASIVAAWLNVLGYDAYALLYSANGMIYSSLESHTFTGAVDLAYESDL